MCEVGTITRHCGAATPGIAKLYLIDVADVVSIPLPNDQWTITDSLILALGTGFKDIPFVEQKAGISDDVADAVGGGFKKEAPIKLAKYSPETNKWINKLIGARFIAVVADNNGQMIIMGDQVSPMRLEKAKGATGQKFGDENGWDLNLVAEGSKPCYFYEGPVVIDDGTVVVFNIQTEDGFDMMSEDGQTITTETLN